MEEQEYRATYQAINQRRCVFEKAINARRCACKQSKRFNLADREGVACMSETGNRICTDFLNTMRHKARFSLHVTHADAPLPHAKEIRVQAGGLTGLHKLLHPQSPEADRVGNIYGLLMEALERYQRIDAFPYHLIVQTIVSFQGRKKRNRPTR